jgi:hypothetical protein
VDAAYNEIPVSISSALRTAVFEEFEENRSRIREEDNESSLSDRMDALKKFASRYGVSEIALHSAVSEIKIRIGEIEERSSPAPSLSITPSKKRESETFDDDALTNLFVPLLDR